MEYVQLTQIDFDGMENSIAQAITKKDLGIFLPSGTTTAHGTLVKWLNNRKEKYSPYLGWDGEVYPKFKVKSGETKE